jgi:hypothetical protein
MIPQRAARLSEDHDPGPSFVPALLASMSGTDLLLLRVKMGAWIAPEIEAELDRRATGADPGPTSTDDGRAPFRIRRPHHHRRRAPAA